MTALPRASRALQKSANQHWIDLLSQSSTKYSWLGYRGLKWSSEELTLTTDQCVTLMMDFAQSVGVDLPQFGRKLSGEDDDDGGSEFLVGIALRTILEVDGYYVERPNASSRHFVPKDVLIAIGAAVIGIATGESTALGPIVSGAIGGVGSLLINILASRYSTSERQRVDFYGELLLQLVEDHQPVSRMALLEYTRFHAAVLDKILSKLEGAGEIEQSLDDNGRASFRVASRGKDQT
ncbi:TPA: hypothetical protein QDB31_005456 [Burkholderia vietnamiensis]|nr:hypothetical protein [Burkholderia vietnamiensis]